MIKQIIKAVVIWLILLIAYYVLSYWFNLHTQLISDIFGIQLIRQTTGLPLVMKFVFPNCLISAVVFVVAYLTTGYVIKKRK